MRVGGTVEWTVDMYVWSWGGGWSKQRQSLKSPQHIVLKTTCRMGSHTGREYMYIKRKKEPKTEPLLFSQFRRKG